MSIDACARKRQGSANGTSQAAVICKKRIRRKLGIMAVILTLDDNFRLWSRTVPRSV